MFQNDAQTGRACQVLLGTLGMVDLWEGGQPTPTAVRYLRSSPLSHGEQILLRVAFDFWNGEGGAKFADVIGVLDGPRTRAVATLMMAVSAGPHAVDAWIREWSGPVDEADRGA
jgi:hypothetical protein